MIKSQIWVDLPSAETLRKLNITERITSFFGVKHDLASGEEALTLSNQSLMRGLQKGFEKAGVTNVISMLVDQKVIYIDHDEVPDDFALLQAAVEKSNLGEQSFNEMHLVLEHREAGLHTIIDVRINTRCALGDEEMHITCSARLEELRIVAGEKAGAYQARIVEFSKRKGAFDGPRAALDSLSERIESGLVRQIAASSGRRSAAVVELIKPEAKQLARLRELPFGNKAQAPSYRPAPTHRRNGAYADPYFYYYHDPYYDFTSYIMMDMMLSHGCYHDPYVHVMSPAGDALYAGSEAGDHSAGWASSVVNTDPSGDGVNVDSSVPLASTLGDDSADQLSADIDNTQETPADFGSSDGSGPDGYSSSDEGGASDATDTSSDGGGFWSSMFGGDSGASSDSSCGSSCSSGSSCGSSCSSCGGGD